MPAITLPDTSSTSFTSRSVTLLRRAILERAADHGNIVKPGELSAGILFVFCLLGASLGLLAWWLFIRRSGFIWHDYDWAEYKSSVLRRPEERPDDAITVFSDGTARKGGPMGSSVGARTVVLGELDTTYTKSYVAKEKPWGPRDLPSKGITGGRKKGGGGFMGSVWGKVEGSMWGKLRGGEPSDNDTVVQREKSLRKSRHRSRRHRSKREQREHRAPPSEFTEGSYMDNERPAPPLTDITRSSEASSSTHQPPYPRVSQPSVRRPARVSTRAGKAPVKREPSYAIGDDRAAHYHQHRRTQSRSAGKESSSSDDTSSSSDSDSEDDSSDDESALQSQIGMAKGNKVYHHPISQDRVFWGNARPVEKNGGGAGGTFGGGAPALMPRGYRAASAGSLSSEGSVRSSHVGK